jgi:hypothetical protein
MEYTYEDTRNRRTYVLDDDTLSCLLLIEEHIQPKPKYTQPTLVVNNGYTKGIEL